MIGTNKYLGLLVSIALVVGQVQYAYAAYYCTMVHHRVDTQSELAVSQEGHVSNQTCNVCDCTATSPSAQERYEPDCLRVTAGHKDVTNSFQETSLPNIDALGSPAVLPVETQTPCVALHSIMSVSSLALSSPGIPTINNNLRI